MTDSAYRVGVITYACMQVPRLVLHKAIGSGVPNGAPDAGPASSRYGLLGAVGFFADKLLQMPGLPVACAGILLAISVGNWALAFLPRAACELALGIVTGCLVLVCALLGGGAQALVELARLPVTLLAQRQSRRD